MKPLDIFRVSLRAAHRRELDHTEEFVRSVDRPRDPMPNRTVPDPYRLLFIERGLPTVKFATPKPNHELDTALH